jgi:transcriptional regulator with XRE-family HTH domain
MKGDRTDTPFTEELPRLLEERGMSLRALAARLGIADSHLSRVLRLADYKRASPELMTRIAMELGLQGDYFAEIREAYVIAAVQSDAKLRNDLYTRLKRREAAR